VEVDSSVGVVGVVSGSKGVGEAVGYMIDSRNGVMVVLDRSTVGWGLAEGTLDLFRSPYPGPALFPCPFVPGVGSHVHGSPDVAEGGAVIGTLVG